MKCTHLTLTFLLLVAGTAQAASNVTTKFDGIYTSSAEPAPAMGAAGCPAFSLGEVNISRGFLRTTPAPDRPVVTGFITEEGYVAAYVTRPGHSRSAMDGRLDEGVIVAGFIEGDSNCMWVVRLTPRR